jgi:hypothetical protein
LSWNALVYEEFNPVVLTRTESRVWCNWSVVFGKWFEEFEKELGLDELKELEETLRAISERIYNPDRVLSSLAYDNDKLAAMSEKLSESHRLMISVIHEIAEMK